MKVVIPAAGAGKRFASHGVTTPKELLPLGGKPLIAHALAEAKRAGFESAVVVVSPSKPALIDYLATAELALPVQTVIQPQPLGIGDAVLRCWEGEPIAALLPDDVVLETQHWLDQMELHRRTGAAALCVRPVPIEATGRFGIADISGDRILRLVEKPAPGESRSNLAIFGRYVINAAVIDGLARSPRGAELELTAGFAWAAETLLGVRAVQFSGPIYDCGTPADYAHAMAAFEALTG